MQDFLVNKVDVFELSEVNTLRGSHHLNLGSVSEDIVEGDDHTARDVQELTFHGQDFGRGGQVFFETVRWRTVFHQR